MTTSLESLVKPPKVKPHFYAVCFGTLQKIARDKGYNLLLHGSMDRDMDLVAVPWVNEPYSHLELLQEFDDYLNGRHQSTINYYMLKILPGGRSSYILNLHRSYYRKDEYQEDAQFYLDISITPLISNINIKGEK